MLSHLPLPSQLLPVVPASVHAIAFIDSRLEDLPQLVAALNPAIQPYILHPAEDPILQIDAVLRSTSAIHSLYLFGHGAPGIMQLGRGALNTSIVTAHAALISQWQVKEISLYGCEVGQSLDLLEQLHHLTGANIAASRNTLGNGNWHLDVQLGEIKAVIPVQGAYPHHLPVELVRDINPGADSSNPSGFAVFNNVLYFQAYDAANGIELWKVDSNGNASLVKDINPGLGNSNPKGFTVFNNALYFSAYNSSTGVELWRVDSTGNASLVRDLNHGELYDSDPLGFTVFNNALYFSARHEAVGRELWRLDSTGNINLVRDLNFDTNSSSSNPNRFVVFNDALYFSADNGTTGYELWRLDSAGNVSLVQDINPGVANSNPGGFGYTIFNNALYFQARNETTGYELWRLDSAGNASLVQDINSGTGSSSPGDLAVFNNALYFQAYDTVAGRELRRLDSAGTISLVKDIYPGVTGSGFTAFKIFNNALYFWADSDITGRELWRVDSTGNANLVQDINPGSNSSIPRRLTVLNNALYFRADDGITGTELWRVDSNGTASQVQDIALGLFSSFPDLLFTFNNSLYFVADDGTSGTELYRFTPGDVTITQSGSTTSVAEGGITDTYTVVLDTQPTADVTITLTSNQVTTSANTLTFTPQNWNVAQTVTVTAVNDTTVEGTHTGTITHTASSSDSSYNGIAIASVTASITDNDFPNTAPILSDTVVTLARVLPNTGIPTGAVGTLISQIADLTGGSGQNNISDPDSGAAAGIAITAANTSNGSWFYSTNNGSTWNALGAVSNTNARLLAADANTRLYFRPNAGFAGSINNAITFRAWDQTTGTNGSTASTATNGNATAFSTATDTAAIQVRQNVQPDFNRDNNQDILLFNQSTGQVGTWAMDGSTVTSYAAISLLPPDSGWKVVGSADFSKDGKTDLLLRNTLTGENGVWTMDGTTVTGFVSLPAISPGSGWDVVGIGDLSQDGNADILLRNSVTGVNAYWEMDGTNVVSYREITPIAAGSGWEIAGVGDFTKDGNADILLRNTTTGTNAVWGMGAAGVVSYQEISPVAAGSGWEVATVGDFTKDGNTDILWLNSGSGQTFLWQMDGTTVTGGISPTMAIAPSSGWTVV